MTYAWPTASSIHPMRCVGVTREGERCKRRKWITTHEAPEGWHCHQHGSLAG